MSPRSRLFIVLAVSALAVQTVARAVAGQPLPSGPDAMTMQAYRASLLEVQRAMILEEYKSIGHRDPAWDEDALKLLDGLLAWSQAAPGAMNAEELRKLATEVVESRKCDDATVLYAYAFVLDEFGSRRAGEALQTAVYALRASAYSPLRLGSAEERLAIHLGYSGKPQECAAHHLAAVDCFIKAVEQGAFGPGRERYMFAVFERPLRTDLPFDIASSFADRLSKVEGGDPWAVNSLVGAFDIRAAWQVRGNKWAHLVNDEAWAPFFKRLGEAREHLVAAYRLCPTRPEPAAYMITVAMAEEQRREDPRSWFDRAAKAQFDWPAAHSKVQWALLPRWGGTTDLLLEFGRDCKATGRYDTEAPYSYISALKSIAFETKSYDEWEREGVYEGAAEVLQNYSKLRDPADGPAWYKSLQAAVAHRCGKFEEARRLLEELDKRLDDSALNEAGLARQDLFDDVQLAVSHERESILAGLGAMKRGDWAAANTQFESVLPRVVDEPKTQQLITDRLITSRFMRAINADTWTRLPLDKDMNGWRAIVGEWIMGEDGSLIGIPTAYGAFVTCEAPVGRRWRLRGVISLEKVPANTRCAAGFVHSFSVAFGNKQDWQSVLLLKNEKQMAVCHQFQATAFPPAPINGGDNSFEIQSWDGGLVVRLNDQEVFSGRVPNEDQTANGARLGFGSPPWRGAGQIVYRDLEIQFLREAPPGLPSAPPKAAPVDHMPNLDPV